jgi:arsenate reductase (glutaredoxin)
MPPTVYQYPKCSTCRKALKWLDEHGVRYESVHIVEQPPAQRTLARALVESGLPLRAFFNTSGESYRTGGFKERLPSLSQPEALSALAADGKLIKRPLLIDGERVLVGFDEKKWSEALL